MTNRNETAPPKPNTSTKATPAPQPKTWQDISVGSLVLAQESLADGWWEVVVAEVAGDKLTLRWRDYPRYAAFVQNRYQVALLFPGK